MQDDIANSRTFSTFLIRLTTNTDGDSSWDLWTIRTSDFVDTASDPYIEYSMRAPSKRVHSVPVGGELYSVNKLAVLAPYLAVIGVVAAVATVYVAKRRPRA